MITVDSPIVGKGGTVAEALAWIENLATPDERTYTAELFRLCNLVGFDFRILYAQWAHETDDGSSDWWLLRRNPAGIGITGDPAQNAASPTFASGTAAARAHVAHMAAYTGRDKDSGAAGEIIHDAAAYDPRFVAVFDAGFAGTVHNLGDLGNGKWATDPDYAPQIAAKANLIFKEDAVSDVVFGRVPKPPIVELICAKLGPGHGYYELGRPRTNVGVCEHVTDGYGSIEFYHAFFSVGGEREADALVDFVVGRDGRIGMLNDWRGSRAPYANGNTAGVEGDGAAFLAHYAGELDPPNFHLVSIEHEGKAADDWTGAQWNASVALDAWLFDQMGVRYDSFPVNQNLGIVTHLFHSEFTDKGGNALDECPGRYIKQHIGQFQAEVKALMMAHQIPAAPQPVPHPAVPVPTVPWGTDATGRHKLGDADAYAFLGQVTALRDVEVRATASRKGTVIGTIAKGHTGTIRGAFRNKVGRWALIDLGARGVGRAPLSAFEERWPTP